MISCENVPVAYHFSASVYPLRRSVTESVPYLVISSPSRLTTGLTTLIFLMACAVIEEAMLERDRPGWGYLSVKPKVLGANTVGVGGETRGESETRAIVPQDVENHSNTYIGRFHNICARVWITNGFDYVGSVSGKTRVNLVL